MKKFIFWLFVVVGVLGNAPAHADEAAAIKTCGSAENLALVRAVQRGDADQVPDLVAAGADVNAVSRIGWTPLMFAAHNGHAVCVAALLAHGADKNAKTQEGCTALYIAQQMEHEKCVEALE